MSSEMMTSERWVPRVVRGCALSLGLFWLAGACGGATVGTPVVGSESHFLMRCANTEACDSEALSCIAGLCTKSCVAGVDSCSDLASAATCTNQSVEPGAVAICDVSCTGAEDCAALGGGHVCDAGFCRLAALDGARLSSSVCADYGDEVPPPIEQPGVTIVNTGTRPLYLQYAYGATTCLASPSLVEVQRETPSGVQDVNVFGVGCAPICSNVAAEGWPLEGEGNLRELIDCVGVACVGPPASVAIEPGESRFEPARLEFEPGRLPRGCASRISTEFVNCYRRVIPEDSGNYILSVTASVTPECGEGCTPTRFSSPPSRWFFEGQTIEIAAP